MADLIPFRNAFPGGPADVVIAEVNQTKSLLEGKAAFCINSEALTCDTDAESLWIHTVHDLEDALQRYTKGYKFIDVCFFDCVFFVM